MSRQTLSRYAVTTLRGRSRCDFVSLRGARQAFEEEVAISMRLENRTRLGADVLERPLPDMPAKSEGLYGRS